MSDLLFEKPVGGKIRGKFLTVYVSILRGRIVKLLMRKTNRDLSNALHHSQKCFQMFAVY